MSTKLLNTSEYVFDPVAKTIDFSGATDFKPQFLKGIINVSAGKILYMPYPTSDAEVPFLGTFDGNVLTLNPSIDTTEMDAQDRLQITYEDADNGIRNITQNQATKDNIIKELENWTEVLGYKSFSCQVKGTGTGGTIIFEGSNDGVEAVPIVVINASLTTPVLIGSAITMSNATILYKGGIDYRFIRLRIATALSFPITSVTTIFFREPLANIVQNTQTVVSGSLTTVSTVTTTTTVGSVTASNVAPPSLTADETSLVVSANTTTTARTPANGNTIGYNINITNVTGTNPEYCADIEGTIDGTNFFRVASLPKITQIGNYITPFMPVGLCRQYRVVQVVGGTSPAFTRTINRVMGHNTQLTAQEFHFKSTEFNLTTAGNLSPVFLNLNHTRWELIGLATGGYTNNVHIALQGANGSPRNSTAFNELLWTDIIENNELELVNDVVNKVSFTNANYQWLRLIVKIPQTGATISTLILRGTN